MPPVIAGKTDSACGVQSAICVLASLASLICFHLTAIVFYQGYSLDLGSLNFPTPRYLALATNWAFFGTLATMFCAAGASLVFHRSDLGRRLIKGFASDPDWRWTFCASSVAFLIPVLLRSAVLREAPISDDEGSYRFAAQLLASGRLTTTSPAMKLFFDQNFMINNGLLYSAYFLGWPVLLSVGELIGATDYVNPVISACTLPAIVIVVRHVCGRAWVKAGVLLFLFSPFVQLAAATQLSHTACLMALSWAVAAYCLTDGSSDRKSWLMPATMGLFIALAFWVRPQATVPLATPLVWFWLARESRTGCRRFAVSIVAFLGAAVPLALLFLLVLWLQNGAPWVTGYTAYSNYLVANNFRFTTFALSDLASPLPGFGTDSFSGAAWKTVAGLARLNFDLFGWPSSLALLLFSRPLAADRSRVMWAMFGSFILALVFVADWGIDTFGPLHAFELALPVIVLSVTGLRNIALALDSRGWMPRSGGVTFATTLVASLILCALVGFVPYRWRGVMQISGLVHGALASPDVADIRRPAIVFAPFPFVPRCDGAPAHFVFFRPPNDPDLRNDVLWLNDLGDEADRLYLDHMSGRHGYVLEWGQGCSVTLRKL